MGKWSHKSVEKGEADTITVECRQTKTLKLRARHQDTETHTTTWPPVTQKRINLRGCYKPLYNCRDAGKCEPVHLSEIRTRVDTSSLGWSG